MSSNPFKNRCRRGRNRNARPRFRVGDRVRLRDGTVAEVTRVVIRDWTTEYDLSTGAIVAQHHVMERVHEPTA